VDADVPVTTQFVSQQTGHKSVSDLVAASATKTVNIGAGPTAQVKFVLIKVNAACTLTFANDAGGFTGTVIDMDASSALIIYGGMCEDLINGLSTGTKLDQIRIVAGVADVTVTAVIGHDATP
jgi:hypothetical protein